MSCVCVFPCACVRHIISVRGLYSSIQGGPRLEPHTLEHTMKLEARGAGPQSYLQAHMSPYIQLCHITHVNKVNECSP